VSKPSASKRRIYFFCAIPVFAVLAFALIALSFRYHRAAHTDLASSVTSQPTTISPAVRERLQASFASLPLAFEPNQGQTDPQVKYLARANGYTLFLTSQDAVFSFHSKSSRNARPSRSRVSRLQVNAAPSISEKPAVVRMQLVGANSSTQITAADQLPGKSNYYLGNDPKKWQTNVSQYARVAYKSVYPGIDLAYYGEQSKLEFDFIVAPASDPASIELAFSGAQHVATDASGNLVISSAGGDVVLHKPVAYQQQNGSRQLVDASFVLKSNNRVNFDLGSYDRTRELVVDPTVTYSTYLGGLAEDDGYGIASDSSGAAYVTGQTASTNFPTVAGGHAASNAGSFDAFVTKIAADGSSLVYSTYVGGKLADSGNAIALDASGDAFIAGGTTSSDFPTVGPFQSVFGGSTDAFVFELSSNGGTLIYSTYLGGSGDDVATSIALDTSGEAYIVGTTSSSNFPLHTPIQAALAGANNGFVTKLNSSGNALMYSTYLGGGTGDFASAVAVDSSGNAYVTGGTLNPTFPHTAGVFQPTCGTDGTCNGGLDDAFVTVINTAGSAYVYSTFLGGSNTDEGLGIAVDSSGDAYVTGLTASSNFPLKLAYQSSYGGGTDAFVAELNPTGSALVYSTFLGGNATDIGTAIALDGSKNAYITGQTASTNFPTASATQSALGGGNDAFVSEINSAGSLLVFSTYLGGTLNENTATAGVGAVGAIAVDAAGANIYVTGNTTSTNFPTHAAVQGSNGGAIDGFIVKYAQATSAQTFSLTATALTPASVNPGSSATSSITVASANGFTGSVTVSCAVSPVVALGPTCGAATASTAAPATLTVSTTAPVALLRHPANGTYAALFYAVFLPLGGIALTGFSCESFASRRKKLLGLLILGCALSSLALAPACGGGSSSKQSGSPGTPAGAYTITVSGTAAGATQTGPNPSLTLTVN